MIHKNYILRIYESVNHKNSRIMQIIDNTAGKELNNGEKKRTVVFGSHLCDSEFFQKYFGDVQEISADFYRFICSQFDFVPIPQYLFQDTECGSFRTATMGLEMRKDMSTKEKYEYFLDHESNSPKTVYYHCDDLTGILLSELHYYVFGGYKLTECRLCGKKFFAKNLKTQFCLRTGFDEERPQYSCNHIAALQRNNRCSNETVKKKRKVIRETLKRKDEQNGTNSLAAFDREDEKVKASLPSEYEAWILERHKIFVPNAEKRNNKQKSTP